MIDSVLSFLKAESRFDIHGKTLLFSTSLEAAEKWQSQQVESVNRYQDSDYESDGTLGELFGGFIATTINRSGLVLDIGCGLHQKLPHYVKDLNLTSFIGIEPLPVVVERDFYCLTGVRAESIPLKDGVAGSAIFATSLDHIENSKKAVEEVLRTLVSNGHLYFWLGVHDPFILAEAKTFGVIHNNSKGLRKWVRIFLAPIEHLIIYFKMKIRAKNLVNGKPLDAAHVRYHTLNNIDSELNSYGLKIVRKILVPGSASLFVEAIRL